MVVHSNASVNLVMYSFLPVVDLSLKLLG
jgi:hypothetical protein